MKIHIYLFEALAFILVTIFIFNAIVQLLQTLNLYAGEDIKLIGMIAVLLALDNLVSRKFFGFKILA